MWKSERGVCILSIEEMKNVDVRTVKREELADIREVEVNKGKAEKDRLRTISNRLRILTVIDMGNMLLRLALRIQQ